MKATYGSMKSNRLRNGQDGGHRRHVMAPFRARTLSARWGRNNNAAAAGLGRALRLAGYLYDRARQRYSTPKRGVCRQLRRCC